MINKVKEDEKRHSETFATLRDEFILQKIKEVSNDQKVDATNTLIDYVDISSKHENLVCCSKCLDLYPKSSDVKPCKHCSFDPHKFALNYDPYDVAEDRHHPDPMKIIIANPNMNNPNSVEDVGTFEINTYEVYESVQYLIDSNKLRLDILTKAKAKHLLSPQCRSW